MKWQLVLNLIYYMTSTRNSCNTDANLLEGYEIFNPAIMIPLDDLSLQLSHGSDGLDVLLAKYYIETIISVSTILYFCFVFLQIPLHTSNSPDFTGFYWILADSTKIF